MGYLHLEYVRFHQTGTQGVVKLDDLKFARWPAVLLQPGMNNIEATTRSRDKALSDSCKWVLEPAAK